MEADHCTSDDGGRPRPNPKRERAPWNSEVTRMEHRGNEARGQIEDGGRNQDPGRFGEAAWDNPRSDQDNRFAKAAASQSTGAQGSISIRDLASWVNWQFALYAFVLGTMCILLAPLTSFWWLALLCGTAVPIALAMLDRSSLVLQMLDDGKVKERELLHILAERGELTPTTAAMRTSLTVDEASKMLQKLD